jgi:hypothetical protein
MPAGIGKVVYGHGALQPGGPAGRSGLYQVCRRRIIALFR